MDKRGNARAILLVTSHVVRGRVGARAQAFALERLGFEPWILPTIILPFHPGHGKGTAIRPDAGAFGGLVDDLIAHMPLETIAGVITGYIGDASLTPPITRLIAEVREANPDVLVCCDPVIGDVRKDGSDGLYIPEETAMAVRDHLIPAADLISPNRFELGWLAGLDATPEDNTGLLQAGDKLGRPRTLITSAHAMMRNHAANILMTDKQTLVGEATAFDQVPHGPGDLTAALMTANLLRGLDPQKALRQTVGAVHEVLALSHKMGSDELELIGAQAFLDKPRFPVSIRQLAQHRPIADKRRVLKPQPLTGQSSSASHEKPKWLAGVDGAPDGWVVVLIEADGDGFRVTHVKNFAEILALPQRPEIVAIDMPIGLPDQIEGPGRPAEQAVRPHLGPRQSSVFSIPARSAVYAPDYATACTEALGASMPPRKISKQGFNIFPKIREIDALMTPALQARVFESHPEMVFTLLNGGSPAPFPKKVKSRANPEGLDWRRDLLIRSGLPAGVLDLDHKSLGRAGADDLVDAAACALCARRIHDGKAQRFPADIQRDARGLDIAIWA